MTKALGIAVLVALARALFRDPVALRSRLGCGGRVNPPLTLVLEMVAVSLRQGASIPFALEGVGRTLGGAYAETMIRVARLLVEGNDWYFSWAQAMRHPWIGEAMTVLSGCLESSWLHGTSPLNRMDTTIDQVERKVRSRLDQETARLSIRILMPTGLCILPAFVLIGVIPCIAAFAGGMF